MNKIIWQPVQLYNSGRLDFGVILDREFAEMMVSKKLDGEKILRFNNFVRETISKRAFNPHILFYDDTALAVQLNTGSGGVWLTVDSTYGKNPLEVYVDEHIKYSSHNVDTTADRDVLLRMMNIYVEYSDMIAE